MPTKELSTSDGALYHAKVRWQALFEMELRHDAERQAAIDDLTDGELQFLVDDAALFSQTNCGWFEYTAMQRAAPEARWRIRRNAKSAAS